MSTIDNETKRWSASTVQQVVAASSPLPQMESEHGERYSPGEKIGEGGMGQVFRAADNDLARDVALKTLKGKLRTDMDSVWRFLREAQSTGRLEHPGIPPVHEVALDSEGVPFYTMKLVRGETLSDIIAKLAKGDPEYHKRFSFAIRAHILMQLCDVVHFAHQNGVYHRDIKPDNVMVGAYGEVQLMDWGASYDEKILRGDRSSEPGFIGTPRYAAPERFVGGAAASLTPQSEVWSLGLLMHELFTLQPAFADGPLLEVIERVRKRPIAASEGIRAAGQSRCPRQYANIIRAATFKDPNKRYATPALMREALQDALEMEAPVVCPCTGLKRGLGLVDRLIDNFGPLFVVFLVFWLMAPIPLLAWIAFTNF